MGLVQYADNGFFAPRKIAEALRTTSEEVARTAGLGRDAVQRKERVRSDRTQRRLREMIEVINKLMRVQKQLVRRPTVTEFEQIQK